VRSRRGPARALRAQPTTIRLEALFLLRIGTDLRPGEALALRGSDLDLAFATPLGLPLDGRNSVNRHFKPMLLRAGLPATVRRYDLRHSLAIDVAPHCVGTQTASKNAIGRLGSTGRPSCIYSWMLGFRVVELGGIEPPTS